MLLSLVMVVAVKVFKKSTPNGKMTIYLGKRDFIDHLDYCDPIDGVIVVDNEYLRGRKVFGQLMTSWVTGREEDEVMGVKFSKDLVLAKEQIVPLANPKMEMTPMQERLVKKLGANAFPFTFHFPPNSPSSVTLQAGDDDQGRPLGVEYFIKAYVGEHEEDKSHKRSQIKLVSGIEGAGVPVMTRNVAQGCPSPYLLIPTDDQETATRPSHPWTTTTELTGEQGIHLFAGQNQPGGHAGPRDVLPRREDLRQCRHLEQLPEDGEEHQVLRGAALRGDHGQCPVQQTRGLPGDP